MILVERPDLFRQEAKPSITFKETRDSLFKFFMLAGIPFIEGEKLKMPSGTFSVQDQEILLHDAIWYKPTARLLDIEVDGKAIYVFIVPEDYNNLDQRVRKKLIAFGQGQNLIVFDRYDCKTIGLDISGSKQWLKPLSKPILKIWAKKLFQKISDLKGDVTSSFNLNDLYEQIELHTSSQSSQTSLINAMRQESIALKTKLKKLTIKECFTVTDSHDSIIENLGALPESSSLFIEELVAKVINQVVKSIDLRQDYFKDLFRLKNGKIDLTNKDVFCSFIESQLSKKIYNLEVKCLGHGFLEITNLKSLQTLTLFINPSYSSRRPVVSVPESVSSKLKNLTVFSLLLQFKANSSNLIKTLGEVFILDSVHAYSRKYECTSRMQVYDSTLNSNYSLWG